jgi:predicted nucleotide-binding protein
VNYLTPCGDVPTPDDPGWSASDPVNEKRRARQNVIFEMGYFYGKLQRRKGRVTLLYSGDLELPSDIAGVIYINISDGIESAGEALRRELADWL